VKAGLRRSWVGSDRLKRTTSAASPRSWCLSETRATTQGCKSGACCRGEIRTVAANHKLSAIRGTRHRLTYRQRGNLSASSLAQAIACQRAGPSPAVTHETSVVCRTRSFENFTKHPAILYRPLITDPLRAVVKTTHWNYEIIRAQSSIGPHFWDTGCAKKIGPESIALGGITGAAVGSVHLPATPKIRSVARCY